MQRHKLNKSYLRFIYLSIIHLSFVTTHEFSVRVTMLLQGLVSHELTVYLPVFDKLLLNELWAYYQKDVKQINLNHTIP